MLEAIDIDRRMSGTQIASRLNSKASRSYLSPSIETDL